MEIGHHVNRTIRTYRHGRNAPSRRLPLWVHGVVFHVCHFRPPETPPGPRFSTAPAGSCLCERIWPEPALRRKQARQSHYGNVGKAPPGDFFEFPPGDFSRLTRPSATVREKWWSRSGSNRRPQRCERCALPTELRPHDANPGRMGGRIMVSRPIRVKRSERVLKPFPDTVCACTRIAPSLGSAQSFAPSTNHGKHHECRPEPGR